MRAVTMNNSGVLEVDTYSIKGKHERRPISPAVILKAFIAPIITIASGGSVGKEAPAADMGAPPALERPEKR